MSEIRCPKCGAPMYIRTAQKGRYAGRQFYGCSNYPSCRRIIDIDSADSTQVHLKSETYKSLPLPHRLSARERFKGYQTRFIEAMAVPQELLLMINNEDLDENIVQSFSQWRIDFPTRDVEPKRDDAKLQILSIAEKILTRGRITLASPTLEREFEKAFLNGRKLEVSTSNIYSLIYTTKSEHPRTPCLDSSEENSFYENILPGALGSNYAQFVIPQLEISSLISADINVAQFERVDFAIFHPKIANKIVVEIDGKQHERHTSADQERDAILRNHGFTVIRIPTAEIHKRSGSNLSSLLSTISITDQDHTVEVMPINKGTLKFVQSIKYNHQIQLALLQAIQSEFLKLDDIRTWQIAVDFGSDAPFDYSESLSVLITSVSDFIELIKRIAKLYSIELPKGKPSCVIISSQQKAEELHSVFIAFSDRFTSNSPTFHIQNIFFPFHIANSSSPSIPLTESLTPSSREDLRYFLQYLFRKDDFWEGQYDGITRTLQAKDTLLLLPTGGGKSLVYQLASFLLPGLTITIDPIIALMEDQIYNLSSYGIDRCIAITSHLVQTDREKVIKLFAQGEFLFAFISPERFQTEEFRKSLRTLTIHTPIAVIVVDEAHCVSEWGHDFRTAYLNIGRTSRNYCESNGQIPPLLGLTGTASRAVLKDVQRELQIDDFSAIITPQSFNRPELKFSVIHSSSEEKAARLMGYLAKSLPSLFNTTASHFYRGKGEATYSGLIFCPHINGEFGVVDTSEEIANELDIRCAPYSGGRPHHWNLGDFTGYKQNIAREYKRNTVPLLVCTNAFGMGIDKPNIRYTIHYNIPPSIEAFYQEAGRAGRNRKTAYCCIIASNDDPKRTDRLLSETTSVEEISDTIESVSWEENDDITRRLYFHTRAFRGISQEKQDIEEILKTVGDISRSRVVLLTIPAGIRSRLDDNDLAQARTLTEKALHRLLLVGIISDYTIDYNSYEFNVKLTGINKEEMIEEYGKYVASYHQGRSDREVEAVRSLLGLPLQDFAVGIIDRLLHFIYDVIERGRRRALREMLLACSVSSKDNDIRLRILQYLEETEYSKNLDELLSADEVGIKESKDIIAGICSPNEAAELRGQVARYLESYPDHPSLLMLRSVSEALSRDKNTDVVIRNFIASVSSAFTKYSIDKNNVFEFISWVLSIIKRADRNLTKELITELFSSYPDQYLAKSLISELPIEFTDVPAWYLLFELQKDCNSKLISSF